MDDKERRRVFQRIKQMAVDQFWVWMDRMNGGAYALAIKHVKEAMSTHPRISQRMIEEVLQKAEEIREEWDGIKTVTVSDTEAVEFDKIMGGERVGRDRT